MNRRVALAVVESETELQKLCSCLLHRNCKARVKHATIKCTITISNNRFELIEWFMALNVRNFCQSLNTVLIASQNCPLVNTVEICSILQTPTKTSPMSE